MIEALEFVMRAVLIGIVATGLSDLWTALLTRLGLPGPNWALVGRWIGHFPRGEFTQASVARAEPVAGERMIGWSAHYLIGIAFAAILLAIAGPDWAHHPTLIPALLFGVVTVAAPFLVMQPAMGAGIASSKTPNPAASRLRSLAGHTAFGISLYLSALIWAQLLRL